MKKSPTIKGPVVSIAIYQPKRGKARQLRECVDDHQPILRKLKLVTARKSIAVQAADGSILEIFEWKSQKAIDEAHRNPAVIELWERFNNCCTYGTLSDLREVTQIFPGFVPVN